MNTPKQSFSARIDVSLLEDIEQLALQQNKTCEELIETALRDYLHNQPRSHVKWALAQSISEHQALYKKLAD